MPFITKQEDILTYFFLKKKDYLYLKDNINKRTGKGEGFWRRKKPCCPFPSHAALSHQSHFKPTHSIFYLFIYLFLIFKIFSNQPIKNCRHKLTRAPHHTLIILPYFENQIQSLSLFLKSELSQIRMYFFRSRSLSLSLSLSQISLCVFKKQRFNSSDPWLSELSWIPKRCRFRCFLSSGTALSANFSLRLRFSQSQWSSRKFRHNEAPFCNFEALLFSLEDIAVAQFVN